MTKKKAPPAYTILFGPLQASFIEKTMLEFIPDTVIQCHLTGNKYKAKQHKGRIFITDEVYYTYASKEGLLYNTEGKITKEWGNYYGRA